MPPIDTAATAAEIERSIRAVGTPERAIGENAYLKSDLEHCGATLSEIRRIARAVASAHPDLTHDELIDLVGVLWSQPLHDCRMAAIMLLEFRPRLRARPASDGRTRCTRGCCRELPEPQASRSAKP